MGLASISAAESPRAAASAEPGASPSHSRASSTSGNARADWWSGEVDRIEALFTEWRSARDQSAAAVKAQQALASQLEQARTDITALQHQHRVAEAEKR